MYLQAHGGHCCGIRHIWGLGTDPTKSLPALAAPTVEGGVRRHHSSSPASHYIQARPAETAVERLDAYLTSLRAQNPGGLVEVVLRDAYGKRQMYLDQLDWVPVLEGRGFRFVGRCLNSNSKNFVYVFHLTLEKDRAGDDHSSFQPATAPFPWETYGFTPPKPAAVAVEDK
jgi:hypothetical protein